MRGYLLPVLLSVRKQRVQMRTRLCTPLMVSEVLWMFGAQRRLVAFAAWLTLCPNMECLPQISQVPVPAKSIDPLY